MRTVVVATPALRPAPLRGPPRPFLAFIAIFATFIKQRYVMFANYKMPYNLAPAIMHKLINVQAMKAPKKQGETCPEGNHPFTVIGFIDLGTQDAPAGTDWAAARKCVVELECTSLKKKDGTPHILSKRFTFSSSAKSTLAKTLRAWLGVKDAANFDMEDLLGKTGFAKVEHTEKDGNTYANIVALAEAPKGVKIKPALTPSRLLFLDKDNWDQEVFDSLPEFYQEKIMSSPEYDDMPRPKVKTKPAPAAKKKGK